VVGLGGRGRTGAVEKEEGHAGAVRIRVEEEKNLGGSSRGKER